MSNHDYVATVSATVDAPVRRVWDALVTPDTIRQYMFGTEVTSTWEKGSEIRWKGTWEGRAYEDKGVIVAIEPERRLEYTHYSPLSGAPDTPENYHHVRIELSGDGERTRVTLTQDNNPTEAAKEHSEKNWGTMLEGLRKVVE